jgi:hypothetical protein
VTEDELAARWNHVGSILAGIDEILRTAGRLAKAVYDDVATIPPRDTADQNTVASLRMDMAFLHSDFFESRRRVFHAIERAELLASAPEEP